MLGSIFLSPLRITAAFLLLATSNAFAVEVKVTGVHLCCGNCVRAAARAIDGLDGISKISVDKDEELVTFEATDDEAVKRGLTALTDKGFYGKTSVPGPEFKIDAAKNADEVTITKMHLCCGGCVNAAEAALKDVKGVKSISTQSRQGTMTLKGEKINLAEALKALHETGMHGKVE